MAAASDPNTAMPTAPPTSREVSLTAEPTPALASGVAAMMSFVAGVIARATPEPSSRTGQNRYQYDGSVGATASSKKPAPRIAKPAVMTRRAPNRAENPAVHIVIAGMRSVPNLGRRYAQAFSQTYVELAQQNEVALVPFLLEGVAAVRALNQADGLHPTAAGHRVIAENLWPVLESVLREARPGS